jgi:hypothetical protein
MSKYSLRYYSASKGEEVDIEALHSSHLLNAWRKGKAAIERGEMVEDELFRCMEAEVKARGLDKPLDGQHKL